MGRSSNTDQWIYIRPKASCTLKLCEACRPRPIILFLRENTLILKAKCVIFLLNLKLAEFWKKIWTYVILVQKDVLRPGFLHWLSVVWYFQHPKGILERQNQPSNSSNFCIKVRWHFLTHFLNLLWSEWKWCREPKH